MKFHHHSLRSLKRIVRLAFAAALAYSSAAYAQDATPAQSQQKKEIPPATAHEITILEAVPNQSSRRSCRPLQSRYRRSDHRRKCKSTKPPRKNVSSPLWPRPSRRRSPLIQRYCARPSLRRRRRASQKRKSTGRAHHSRLHASRTRPCPRRHRLRSRRQIFLRQQHQQTQNRAPRTRRLCHGFQILRPGWPRRRLWE